ncbi:LPS export ABC transporter periplasmic protein LptC [Emcibacter sp. SYSU 3D8]|uniref:LPS export ABC transporter periplasmic protein LptC n=1 Tax=Emcibacter sp. SYSU 3D8 TaxID=3133969 RepID=UPI0031FE8B19
MEQRYDLLVYREDRYSRYVRMMKRALPAGAALLLAGILIVPAIRGSSSGFTLAFSELKDSDDKARMISPRFVGTDTEDRTFSVSANSAYHDASNDELVMLETISADLKSKDGSWVTVDAPVGTFHTRSEVLDLTGQVNVFSDSGMEVHTPKLTMHLSEGTGTSDEAVHGQGPFGKFQAGGLDVDTKTENITLRDGVKMTVYPRAVD